MGTLRVYCKQRQIRELISDDGNGKENVTWKYNFISFVLLRDYFNSLNLYKSGELSMNQIGRSGVQVKKENEKFTAVRSRSPQNLECGHFTLLGSLKAGFHMIADRRSLIADRNKVCDRLRSYGNYFCDRLRSCDRDRRRSQKIEPCSI